MNQSRLLEFWKILFPQILRTFRLSLKKESMNTNCCLVLESVIYIATFDIMTTSAQQAAAVKIKCKLRTY